MPGKTISLIVLTTVVSILACGPSIRRTYQSDNAFARCFDMDYDPAQGQAEKKECWSTLLEKRIYNQEGDKVKYAELRLKELADGISIPGPPGPPGSFHERPKLPQKAAKKAPMEKTAPSSAPSTAKCEESCKQSLKACQGACSGDAGVADTCQAACETGYRACMKGCFE